MRRAGHQASRARQNFIIEKITAGNQGPLSPKERPSGLKSSFPYTDKNNQTLFIFIREKKHARRQA